MLYDILYQAAQSPDGLFLHAPAEIAVFQSLQQKELVTGSVHRPRLQPPYAVVHCVTPDGRALLALLAFLDRKRASGSSRSVVQQ